MSDAGSCAESAGFKPAVEPRNTMLHQQLGQKGIAQGTLNSWLTSSLARVAGQDAGRRVVDSGRTMTIVLSAVVGCVAWFLVNFLVAGLFTVDQNDRAVKTRFGRAVRLDDLTTLDDPLSETLTADQKARYVYPQVNR